jgi:hypothetical protein
MFLRVYHYRCKCGVRLQVLTEADKARIDERILVACPRCQEKQVVYAHRITKIEVDPQSYVAMQD